jgi:hypothetical protein
MAGPIVPMPIAKAAAKHFATLTHTIISSILKILR